MKVEAGEDVDEQCLPDIPIEYAASTSTPSADVDYWNACVVDVSYSSIDHGATVEAGERAGEQCCADIFINNVPSASTLLGDVDSWTACVADVDADLRLESAIVDSRTKQLETAARCCSIGASTITVDDDGEDINSNVVVDPALPTAPHPLIS